MATLHFFRQDREVLRYPFNAGALRLGRHPANDLTLPDEEISRFHLTLERREGVFWVVDQSRNGTTLNGRRVREAPLKNGDRIGLAAWSVVFAADDSWGDGDTLARKPGEARPSFCGMLGQSEAIKRVFEKIERAAPTNATVLILGETGSGKELAARAIHERSARARHPFVPLNCGAISPQLIESELFGHERGAFTGALNRHLGAFEQAEGGTLFLDEIGELPVELQPKLLRVLEDRRFRRVGGAQEVEADVRVVAATHRSLVERVKEGKFREDLFFRLYAVPVPLPALRERRSDIPVLAAHFLEVLQAGSAGTVEKHLSHEALGKLTDHAWKGNVRELKNVLMRSLLFAPGPVIGPEDLLFLASEEPEAQPFLKAAERDAIVKALRQNDWNKKRTAEALGIAKSTLFQKIRDYGIKEDVVS
ncbi:MAG TPA: sigma 54-interacting transcriptional regulator [bacterium]|nr:sigma 54-interacting transcriptional regulator [bacterium]